VTAPRISVLLPCFNHGQFIDEAVESVLTQTCQEFEIVIVDDGSTDGPTVEKLASYDAPRTRVLRIENSGLPAARNHAARHAGGQIFCALDADDRLAPTWFEKGLRVLDEQPSVAFVSHWLETFGDEQWTWTPERCDLPALLARNSVNGAALVRREAFEAVSGYDEALREGCEDWDFWLRLVERGWPGAIIPEVLFYYRRRADSMSRLMLQEEAYRRPLDALVARHEGPYRNHLVDVIVAKEREALHLDREVSDLERDRLTELEPALRRAREELAAISLKVTRARERVARIQEIATLRAEKTALEHQTASLQADILALRSSWSWWISAPLRAVLGIMRGERR
jgi:glycosyltransferase involved in cell wall biosynthesis